MKLLLAVIASALLLTSCATGTPGSALHLQVDRDLLIECPATLPAASRGTVSALRANRVEAKLTYEECRLRHRALAEQIKNHLDAESKSE